MLLVLRQKNLPNSSSQSQRQQLRERSRRRKSLFQQLEQRHLLAGDVGFEPSQDAVDQAPSPIESVSAEIVNLWNADLNVAHAPILVPSQELTVAAAAEGEQAAVGGDVLLDALAAFGKWVDQSAVHADNDALSTPVPLVGQRLGELLASCDSGPGQTVGQTLTSAIESIQIAGNIGTLDDLLAALPAEFSISSDQTVGDTRSFVLQFTPAAFSIPTQLSLADQIPGSKFESGAEFNVQAQPTFRLPIEVDLSMGTDDDQRVHFNPGVEDEVSVALSATIDDVNAIGTAGLLAAAMTEQSPATTAVDFEFTADLNVSTGPVLVTSLMASDLTASIDPGAVKQYSIPGLTLTQAINHDGGTDTFGAATIDTDVAGSDATATFSTIAELRSLFADGISVEQSNLAATITPSDVLSMIMELGTAIESISQLLDDSGDIPFVNQTVSDITDFVTQTTDLAKNLYANPEITGDIDITAASGVLDQDATFVITIEDQDPVLVIVPASATNDNADIDDLYVDVNTALATAGLAGKVIAERPVGDAANKLSFRTENPVVGTTMSVSTLQATGETPASSSGRLSRDVMLSLQVDSSNLENPVDVSVTITAASTESNTSLADLVRDINAAMAGVDLGDGTELDGLIVAQAVGRLIQFSAIDTTGTALTIQSGGQDLGFADGQSAADNVASTVLGLGTSQSASAELAFSSIEDFVTEVSRITGESTVLTYDAVNERVTFGLKLSDEYSQSVDLDFSEVLDLGLLDLNLAGGAEASFTATAGIDLTVGVDLGNAPVGPTVDSNTLLGTTFPLAVALTTSSDAAAATGTLGFTVSRFDGISTPQSITIAQADLDDNVDLDDFVADLNDKIADLMPETPVLMSVDDAGKLVLSANDQNVNEITITQAAFGLTASSTQHADLVITTADGVATEVVLDGVRTLGDVVSLINTVPHVVASIVDNQFVITDSSTPVGDAMMSIEDANGSTAATSLGIAGDADGDHQNTDLMVASFAGGMDTGVAAPGTY